MRYFRFSEKDGEPVWVECRTNSEQYLCNYYYEKVLRSAAQQGRVSARRLSAGAERAVDAVEQASGLRELLNANRALEQTLTHVLCSELASVREPCR